MSAIRPDLPALTVTSAPAASQLRSAQAAFFRAALNEATAASSQPAQTSAPDGEPARAQRPGALLDIRV